MQSHEGPCEDDLMVVRFRYGSLPIDMFDVFVRTWWSLLLWRRERFTNVLFWGVLCTGVLVVLCALCPHAIAFQA